MNKKNNQALFDLVTEYENLSENGVPAFFDEKVYLKLIAFYREDDQLDRALEVVEHALKHHGFSSDFYIKKAQLLLDSHQEEETLQVLEQAATFAPSEPEIYLLKAEALIYLGYSRDAFNILEDLKGTTDRKVLSDVYLVEALAFESQEEFERMFYALKAALKENPANKEALERLWLCVELSKKYEESVALHEEILDADAYSFMAWYNLGHAHAYLGNYETAIEAYEFAFVIDENFEYAYRDCADLCFELKNYQKALKIYLEYIDNFEADGDVLLLVGRCYQYLFDYDAARTAFTRAIYLDPLNDEVYFHIGECYAGEKAWDNAIHYYRKALSIEDQQEEYYAALAQAYVQTETVDKAAPNFKRAIDIAPEESKYWINFANFLMETGQGEKALNLLEDAENYAAGTELLYARIACLFNLGRRQEALYWLGEALYEDYDAYPSLFSFYPVLENDPAVVGLIQEYMS